MFIVMSVWSGRTERKPNEEVERYEAGVSDLLVQIGTLVFEGVQCTPQLTHLFPAHTHLHEYVFAVTFEQLGPPTHTDSFDIHLMHSIDH